MSLFGVGLGSFAGAAADGFQSGQEIAQKALQLKQYQAQLDTAKKQVLGRAIAYKGLESLGQGPGQGQGQPMPGPGPAPGMMGGGPMAMPAGATPTLQGFQGGGGALQPGVSRGPQPPMPGEASVPRFSTQPRPAPMMPGAQPSPAATGPGAGQGGPPAAPMALPPGPQASSPPGQPGGAPPAPTQEAISTLRDIYKGLKAANPGVDDETLSYAMEELLGKVKGLAPDMRAQMNYAVAMAREEGRGERQQASLNFKADDREDKQAFTGEEKAADRTSREKMGADRNKTAITTTGMRTAVTARGQDIASGDRAAARQTQVDVANARIDGARATATEKSAYKTLAARRMQINDAMAEENMTAPGSAKWKALSQQKQAIDGEMIKLHSTNRNLPAPSQLVGPATARPGSAPPQPAAPAPAAPRVPAGAPTATGPDGKKVYYDGKAWRPVQ